MILIEVIQAALMEYQTKRGGRVVLQNITKPTVMEWGTALEAMAAVFDMEKAVRSKWKKTGGKRRDIGRDGREGGGGCGEIYIEDKMLEVVEEKL